ncbi:hypothetical protein POM88_015765 [Heracleum sosnowskyi]|uniref:START domain-containing protein n=1 Tax=Heracleum sosnowskyi TaxID=360622 RepID=A0AAD8MWQ0_9APIA|nr:hypothetical protein POM88_015765 [Heracleum sosnowskyi]
MQTHWFLKISGSMKSAFASSVHVLSPGRAVEPATSAALLPGIQSIDELKTFAVHLALQYLHEMRTMCKASRPLWDKWMEMFPSIVSKAKTLQIVEGPSGNLNGSLRLMYAEMQMLRKPSGCIIQECLPRFGCTKVTWLEHMEVEDRPMHPIINQFVSSGVAFGAERWLAVLQRQCERLDRLTGQNGCDRGVSSPEAKSKLMDLAKRMMRAFCVSLSSLGAQSWMNLTYSPCKNKYKECHGAWTTNWLDSLCCVYHQATMFSSSSVRFLERYTEQSSGSIKNLLIFK